jgi:hypothetical protein
MEVSYPVSLKSMVLSLKMAFFGRLNGGRIKLEQNFGDGKSVDYILEMDIGCKIFFSTTGHVVHAVKGSASHKLGRLNLLLLSI